MLTENILDRQIGIVFFNFFNSLFFVQNLNKKNIKKV
jgi:preprotein translocase subunit SecG